MIWSASSRVYKLLLTFVVFENVVVHIAVGTFVESQPRILVAVGVVLLNHCSITGSVQHDTALRVVVHLLRGRIQVEGGGRGGGDKDDGSGLYQSSYCCKLCSRTYLCRVIRVRRTIPFSPLHHITIEGARMGGGWGKIHTRVLILLNLYIGWYSYKNSSTALIVCLECAPVYTCFSACPGCRHDHREGGAWWYRFFLRCKAMKWTHCKGEL